jgi:hypothetical protein
MIVLGLLLMLACAALAADAVVQNGGHVHATAFNQPISGLSMGELFVAGAVLGLVFGLGLMMLSGGLRRSARLRRERRALRAENAELSNRPEPYPSDAEADTDSTSALRTGGRHRAAVD